MSMTQFSETKKVVQEIMGKDKMVCERFVEQKRNDHDKNQL